MSAPRNLSNPTSRKPRRLPRPACGAAPSGGGGSHPSLAPADYRRLRQDLEKFFERLEKAYPPAG